MSEPRPTSRQVDAAWREGMFHAVDARSRSISELTRMITSLNGGSGECYFTRASFSDDPAIMWYVERNRFREIDFQSKYLLSDAFRRAAPGVVTAGAAPELDGPFFKTPFLLSGELAAVLALGGVDATEAVELTARVSRELVGPLPSGVQLFYSSSAWSDWFCDTPWDATWLAVDARAREVWALVITAPWP